MPNPAEQPPRYPPPGAPQESPTRPFPAAGPAGPYRQEYVADPRPAQEAYWSLQSLRTALTIVGLIAIIAVGIAVWALIRANHNRNVASRGSAPSSAILALDNRMNRLETQLRSLSSSRGSHGASTQSLTAHVNALQQAQSRLAKQIANGGSKTASTQQVSQLESKESAMSAKVSQLSGKEAALSAQVSGLQGRVAYLNGQVKYLKGQSSSQTSTTGTSTTP